MRARNAVLAAAVTGLLLSACGSDDDDAAAADDSASVAAEETATPEPTPEPTPEVPDPAEVGANELGKVPVLMYHVIKPEPAGDYDQSPGEFRKELERLYEENYRPVTAADMVLGKIDIPAGMHPVVLTFDDASPTQLAFDEDGELVADTAVAIMEEFEEENPDWKSTATFYVNNGAFGDADAVPWLIENGYEVGAHTAAHTNLRNVSDTEVQKAIATNVAEIEAASPGYTVTTFSRPFGIAPQNKVLAYKGSYEGTSYEFDGVMLVGSNPSVSPFASTFDGHAVARIRSGRGEQELDSGYWLDQLAKSPSSIYTSDGDPDTISYPEDSTVTIAEEFEDRANPYSEDADTDESEASDEGRSDESDADADADADDADSDGGDDEDSDDDAEDADSDSDADAEDAEDADEEE